jgi:Flp pilus assembly protein CpaB
MVPTLRRRLDGPPLALPVVVDRAAERWWCARPRTRALVVVTLATVVVAGVAHAAASPHGPPTPVLVAARDLPTGHVLAPGDLRRAHWPRDLVPAGATTRLEGTVVGPLPRGAVATDRHVTAEGVAAAVPP